MLSVAYSAFCAGADGLLTTQAKKVDKRKLPELRFRMDAGVKNLRAFIKYRERLQ